MNNDDLHFWITSLAAYETVRAIISDRDCAAFLRYAHERFFICFDEKRDLRLLYAELCRMIDAAQEKSTDAA